MKSRQQELPKGKIVFKNKPNENGERMLYIKCMIRGSSASVSTGVAVRPVDWDNSIQQIRSSHKFHLRLNQILSKKKHEIDILIAAYDGEISPAIMRKMMKGEYKSTHRPNPELLDFVQYCFDYNESCYKREKLAFSTYSNDEHCIEMFRKYILETTGESVLPMKDISLVLFDKYKHYCLRTGNKKQSINKKVKPLLKAIGYASKNEVISIKLANNILEDGYFELKARKYNTDINEEEINYLHPQQLQEFVNLYNVVKHERTREFIDMFMFSFYSCGLRFSDLLTLEWAHIDWENKGIKKNLYKGKITHSVPLVENASKILTRWKEKAYNERFVFDLLPADFDFDKVEELDMKRKSKNRSFQTSLQELGRKLPTTLSFNLSIHVARHTFAVMAIEKGISLYMLSKLMGHSSILATEKVYARFLPETIADEVISKLHFDFNLA